MAIVYEKLKNWKIPEVTQTYTQRDTILYALGLGFGSNPVDEDELRFVYEKNLAAVPTMGVVLAAPAGWINNPETGVNYVKVVHGEQSLQLHRPLPASGTLVGKSRVKAIVDKGADKGAIVIQEREIFDDKTGEKIATLESTTFARGDGGFGRGDKAPPPPPAVPDGKPDAVADFATLPQAALIYRLSGDYNPLHGDPAVAKAAGFKQPILHGLCTYGVAGRAILKAICGYDPTKLTGVSARFSSPVYPGETIRTEMYRDGKRVLFRSRVVERNVVVLNNGVATLA